MHGCSQALELAGKIQAEEAEGECGNERRRKPEETATPLPLSRLGGWAAAVASPPSHITHTLTRLHFILLFLFLLFRSLLHAP